MIMAFQLFPKGLLFTGFGTVYAIIWWIRQTAISLFGIPHMAAGISTACWNSYYYAVSSTSYSLYDINW